MSKFEHYKSILFSDRASQLNLVRAVNALEIVKRKDILIENVDQAFETLIHVVEDHDLQKTLGQIQTVIATPKMSNE